jgi:hypothetical protein
VAVSEQSVHPNLEERHGEAGLVFEGMGLKAGDHYPTPEDVL